MRDGLVFYLPRLIDESILIKKILEDDKRINRQKLVNSKAKPKSKSNYSFSGNDDMRYMDT